MAAAIAAYSNSKTLRKTEAGESFFKSIEEVDSGEKGLNTIKETYVRTAPENPGLFYGLLIQLYFFTKTPLLSLQK